jgi:hypothetical protein
MSVPLLPPAEMKNRILELPNLSGYQGSKIVAVSFSQMAAAIPNNLGGSTVPETDNAFAKIIAKAWRDPAFKAELIANPAAALKAEGIDVPDGITVTVVENTDKQFHLVLPPVPTDELSEGDLEAAAGGFDFVKPTYITPNWGFHGVSLGGETMTDNKPTEAHPPAGSDEAQHQKQAVSGYQRRR